MPKRDKILITGSSGMLGVDLCKELGNNYEVCGLDFVQRTAYSVQRFYRCDITNRKAVKEIILKTKPAVVIHTAAWTDVDGCEGDKKKAYKINSVGTKDIVLACKAVGAALVYISTDFVFDGRKGQPYKEIDKTRPLGIYAKSKLKGEEAVKLTLKRYFILRTSWLYGKHGKNFVDTIISKAKEGRALRVVDDQIGSPTYTRDLAKAIGVLLNKTVTKFRGSGIGDRGSGYGAYHISNSGSVSWYEYAKEILRLKKIKTKVIPISSEELARPAKRPVMSVLDNSKFVKFTGHRMRYWKDALKDYLSNVVIAKARSA